MNIDGADNERTVEQIDSGRADDIDALAEGQQYLEALVGSLDKTRTRYKMEISAEKTKLITNSVSGIQREDACESRTLTGDVERRTLAFEMRSYRRLLNMLYKDRSHVTNEDIHRKVHAAIGEYDERLTRVRK